jgi:hypothetical protein
VDPHATSIDRREILAELAPLCRDALALEAWGRLLVFVERRPDGELRVSDLQVEEILDDAAVEQAFESVAARTALPALASAVHALTVLDDLDVDELGGGTFVRTSSPGSEPSLAWLAGCVRTPSKGFDTRRDAVVTSIREKNRVLLERFEIGGMASIEADMERGTARALVARVERAVARQVVLGSFSRRRRSWVWGAHNPTLVEPARRRAAEILDGVPDRSMWEVSTPGFVTDEATAWALAALLAEEGALEGVARVETREGVVLLGLSDVRPADP